MAGARDPREGVIELDEPRLVERVRQGDREAFGQLFDRYSDQAFAVAYGFLQHGEDAEDLVQEAFLRALERIDRLSRGSPFGPWFYRLLVNAALNRRKYLARRRMDVIPATTPGPGDPEGDAERAQIRGRLAEAVATLPDDLATVVILHDLEGFTHSEIARVLQIPEGTCRSHLSRARRMLRQRLEELHRP